MPIPLKVDDHGKLLSDGQAEHIRERTEKLSTFFDRVKRCRVAVDGPGTHPLQGRVRVRIMLTVPGSQISINRQSGADIAIAIRESFDAADQRLEDYVRLSRKAVAGAKRRAKKAR
ncbi:MAG TPA: HPF/RaiA family ribosome-associated protein [Planctomycetota bacterium]|nr:HPF/RaiA family ribosome-associated protein [Planctomycetota bacterium]